MKNGPTVVSTSRSVGRKLGFALMCWALGAADGLTARRIVYPGQTELFELSVIHVNDFHARFEETNWRSASCHKDKQLGNECVGGLGRVVTATRQLLEERPNAIFLNARDHYQGTLWYNLHKWNATSYFMNRLDHDVMTIGNHDFDDGIEGLLPFLRRARAPIVVANIDDSEEPAIQGYYQNSSIIVRANRTIAVIGVILQTTNSLSKTGKLRFLDEVQSVNAEAERLAERGVELIVVLSHAGLDVDRIIAANCPRVDLVVGGHSHSFLYSGKPPFIDEPEDEYPVVVKQAATNRTVLIVQAAAYTKYLGNLTVWFDRRGEVADWEGNPILLDHSIEQDAETMEELKPWAEAVEALGNEVIGETRSFLNSSCRSGECNMANLVTDAMLHSYENRGGQDGRADWAYAAISCTNAGGLRSSLDAGPITYADAVSVQPFENSWDLIELKGEDLYEALEESVSRSYSQQRFVGVGLLHWSGVRVVYNMSQPAWARVHSLSLRCQACPAPKYEPLDRDYLYRIVVPSFLLAEGDDAKTIARKQRNRKRGALDIEQLVDYVKAITPFGYEPDRRLRMIGHFRG